ncbi:MFS transporter [Nocardioides rotundus]|uniref:MFS transporter n=1 Tax=Nocardioides rotundus TaxID=1774216 RepID=UPI001CC1C1C6|nr:MFS transporter [Nocardioides rotundus]UAL28885.1 MFS transporter [Nocardioides rotundus]
MSGPARHPAALGIGVVLLEFAAAVSTLVFSTLLPAAAQDLHGTTRLALLVSGSTIGLFTATACAAPMLARWGTRPMLVLGLASTVVGSVVATTAAGPWWFAGGRFIAGVAAGLLAVVGVSAAIRHLEERVRLRVIAASTAMWIVPGLVGPSAAAGLEHVVGWRWALLAPIPLTILGRVLIVSALPAEVRAARATDGGHRPVGPTLLIPAGVAAFVLATETDLWLVGITGLIAATAGFAALMPRGTLALRRGAPSALAGLTLFGLGYFGATSLVTLALTRVLGTSLTEAGWALGGAPVAWALATLAMPRLQDLGRAPGPAAGLLVTACGVLGTAVLLVTGAPFPWALATWIVVGAGVGVAYPTLYLRATTPDGSADAEQLAAAVITTESFGGLVGAAAGGAAVSAMIGGGVRADLGYATVYVGFGLALALAAAVSSRSAAGVRDTGR